MSGKRERTQAAAVEDGGTEVSTGHPQGKHKSAPMPTDVKSWDTFSQSVCVNTNWCKIN